MQALEAITEHSSGSVPCSRTLQECSINVQQRTILPHPLQPFSLTPTQSQSKHSQSGLSGFSLPTHLALFRPLTVPFLILSIPNSPFKGTSTSSSLSSSSPTCCLKATQTQLVQPPSSTPLLSFSPTLFYHTSHLTCFFTRSNLLARSSSPPFHSFCCSAPLTRST